MTEISAARVRKILCVCTGNSCRSVMAQWLLKHLLKDVRPDIHVLSAGLGTAGGVGPSPETIEVMDQEGIDVSTHVAQPVTSQLVLSADLILVMERHHLEAILHRHPELKNKTFMLKEFLASEPVERPDIPDPIGRPLEVYETCLMTIKDSVARVVEWLRKKE